MPDQSNEVSPPLSDNNNTLAQMRTHLNELKKAALPQTPAPEPIIQFFASEHLPPALQAVSGPFGDVALWIIHCLPRNAERTVALRKLLEAKDAAVRASIAK